MSKNNKDEEKYRLTPYGVLLTLCEDYNVDISHFTPKMAEHFLNDYMEILETQGYVVREEQYAV